MTKGKRKQLEKRSSDLNAQWRKRITASLVWFYTTRRKARTGQYNFDTEKWVAK